MEFWLKKDGTNEMLQLPVNPGEFMIITGAKNVITDIQGLGEINLINPDKGSLAEVNIESIFPTNPEPYSIPNHLAPYEYVERIDKWQEEGRPIRLIITDTSINILMAIENFNYGERGGSRDVEYSLSLREYRHITVKQVKTKIQSAKRPVTRPKPKTYTVRKGDSLWVVSKRMYGSGSKWRTIYNANKKVIGKNPNIIYPGQKLVIP